MILPELRGPAVAVGVGVGGNADVGLAADVWQFVRRREGKPFLLGELDGRTGGGVGGPLAAVSKVDRCRWWLD
ncbi:hypothetical protein GCM10012286_68550 [Streptomyces lasiicapitis]|uniref:Beta-ketoacyl synthase N-terminal domain-containing protein n=1 Tax=Streptomyces lasiicapitis TaxID=1923961 RepID=A0ABQ2MQC6_9ACTN|nr:hypothetical protein GCM10012286_68550 [Streptomyces lasiicapitis]